MIGGAGNDTYYVDSNSDQITEAFNEGTDTVRAAVTFTLGDHLENLILTGTNAIDGTGNALKNTITGNSANNNLFGGGDNDTLNGGDGNDNLEGGNGNDILTGGTGNDTLFGGVGSDKLTGGTGNDRFVFNSLGEGIDTITDFSSTDDVLVVQTLFTNLNYTGTNPIADAYIRGIQSGSNTLIQIDTDGVSSNASFSTLVTLNNFNASNFSQNNLIF
ncbi:calcium-binding protein [Nostoc sp. FACHB-152]|nr:calcium-binding protein [Nostoc sp. FACHB-152]MBD2467509.1 calcium-binding protein [Nostoc sp. FACHB-145]